MSENSRPIADEAIDVEPPAYMKGRVLEQLRYYESSANKAKKSHLRTQTAVIILSVLVPVILNLPDVFFGADPALRRQITATVLSVSLAICTGLAGFRRWGDLWLSFRLTEEVLKQERFLFIARVGDYGDDTNRFSRFVERVESIVSSEHQKFRSLIEQARRPSKSSDDST